jgi:MoxR-like ATPase
MSATVFKKAEEAWPEVKEVVKAANDNDTEGSLAFLRKAINAPSLPEVKEMIKNEILESNILNKIELKIGDVVTQLPDSPRHFLFPEILEAVFQDIPVALIGPAGSGKSTLCEQIADALALKYFLQNSVTGTHELAGYMDAHGKYNTTAFRTAFEKGGMVLIDEVDTSDAGALKWLNTALSNGHAMFPDQPEPVRRHSDFRMIIAANTFGNGADRIYVGANQLDASTLDRFVFFDFRYDEKLETILSGNLKWAQRVQRLRRGAFTEKARMVISPRATFHGAKLLAAGWKQPVVEERLIWKGCDPELRNRIEKKAA